MYCQLLSWATAKPCEKHHNLCEEENKEWAEGARMSSAVTGEWRDSREQIDYCSVLYISF